MFKKLAKFILIFLILLMLVFASLYSCLLLKINLWFTPLIFTLLLLSLYLIKLIFIKLKVYFAKLQNDNYSAKDKNNIIDSFNFSVDYTKKYRKEYSKHLPWFLMLGDNYSDKASLLNEADFAVSQHNDENLSTSKYGSCWDGKDLVVAEVPADLFLKKPSKTALKTWNFFLKNIKSQRKHIKLKGFVLTVAVDTLKGDEKELVTYAINLRKKINHCARVLGYKLPVYFLVTKAENIQGFDDFAAGLPDKLTDQPFGEIFNADTNNLDLSLDAWTESVVARMRAFNTVSLQTNSVLMPRALLLEKQILELQNRLSLFINSFFKVQTIDKIDTPTFKGLFLTSTNKANLSHEYDQDSILEGLAIKNAYRANNKKLYVQDLFTKILPADTSSAIPSLYKAKKRAKYKKRALIIWWSIVMISTIAIGFSYIDTIKKLNNIFVTTNVIAKGFDDEDLNNNLKLIKEMDAELNKVEALKSDSWLFSSWPYNLTLNKAIANFKDSYIQKFDKYIYKDLDAVTVRDIEQAKKAKDKKAIGAIAEVLLQTIKITQSRLDGLPYDDTKALNSSKLLLGKQYDIVYYSNLYKNYLLWNKDKQQLLRHKIAMQQLLKKLDIFTEDPDWIINWVNKIDSNNRIKMSDYWLQSDFTDAPEPNIGSAYRYITTLKVMELLTNLTHESTYKQTTDNYLSAFISKYNLQIYASWFDFTSQFEPNTKTVPSKAVWYSILRDKQVGYSYINYANSIKNNFENKKVTGKKPEWLQLAIKLSPYFKKSLILANTSGTKKSWWQDFKSYISSFYLENEDNTNLWNYDSKMLDAINKYQNQLAITKQFVLAADDKTSFKAVKSLMYKNDASDISNAFRQTANDYAAIITKAQNIWSELAVNSNRVVWNLYRNGFNLLLYGASQNALCYIQNNWDKNIITNSDAVNKDNNLDEWFGNKSLVAKFMEKNIMPFVKYDTDINSYVSKKSYGQIMNFSTFTYDYLNSRLHYKKIKTLESQINKKLKDNAQNISIKTKPTNLNKDAKILPYSTSFEFVCNGKKKVFNNYNTQANFVISSDIFACTKVNLKVNFVGADEFSVTKQYTGKDSVLQLMNKFNKKTSTTFAPKDLSGDISMLKSYNINAIKIGMEFDDLELDGLLSEYSNNRAKIMTQSNDIQNIKVANCWQN